MRSIDILNPLEFIEIKEYEKVETGFLVIGSGIAGLRTALEIAEKEKVTIITKSEMIEANTKYAQGGIAVVYSEDDKFELHIEDTIYAGAGLCEREPVEVLVKEGPARIDELISINTNFDRKENGSLSLTKEAAHSKRRILHAGDTTGAEIERALTEEVKKHKNIFITEYNFLIDVIDSTTVVVYDIKEKKYKIMRCKAVIFATGSIGQVYLNTTNPEVATGDGLAAAYRIGAELSDMEFVQFHPTTFYKKGVPRFLISESLRGEGGILKNSNGERFMFRYHEKGELAPRDVVSRAILNEMQLTGSETVFLDMTAKDKEYLFKRFPNISAFCMDYGVDISKEYIPVSPAAHYMMGGITTDVDGRSSISGIYAAGEVARTGVHGANRLASNSLLEGLVFGKRAGESALKERNNIKIEEKLIRNKKEKKEEISIEKLGEMEQELKKIMWENVGILRDEKRILLAMDEIKKLVEKTATYSIAEELVVRGVEFINMLTVAALIAESALERKESRGAHCRLDYPEKESDKIKHTVVKK